MRALLDRERARSDRTGVVFSLLIYTCSGHNREAQLRALVRLLRRRIRATDEAGWLDGGRLGVLLLDAPHAGASRVAEDVLVNWPAGLPQPACEICTYPSNSSVGESTRERQPAERKEITVGGQPEHALETLFARELPAWKRSLDVVGAGTAIVALSPLLALAALSIKLTSRGPVFFAQQRAGLGGRPFTMYKLRTMVVDAETRKEELRARSEQDGPAFKLKDDPRITTIGRWLRKTSIDELPQFWNILRGEMSLVGPRPLPLDESNRCRGWHRRRLEVTPGLTCIWQVRGRSQVTFVEWMRMDLRYVRSRGLWHDLKLIALTVPAVVLRKGAR
ncbi:MAG: sugar transferase [Pirellulales bacterium]